MGKLSSANTILVDYFDTLVFRTVTPEELVERWAFCLGRKYPHLSAKDVSSLPQKRKDCFAKLRAEALSKSGQSDVQYEDAIGALYECVDRAEELGGKNQFLRCSKQIDAALECGCQYANRALIRVLRRQKEQGKRIVCVSDYYLDAETMRQLMFAAGVPGGLIDEVIVSCDVGKSKAAGDVYPYLIQRLGLDPHKTVMIGDSFHSDAKNAEKFGIRAILSPRPIHKMKLRLLRSAGKAYAERQLKAAMADMFRYGMDYSEYIGMFYVFIKRLHSRLREDRVPQIAFMAREGYYLQKLFAVFEELTVPEDEHIQHTYYWCSRRSVLSGIREMLMPEDIGGEISLRNWLKSLNISMDKVRDNLPVSDAEADEVCSLADSRLYQALMEKREFADLVEKTIQENRRTFLEYTAPFVSGGIFRFVDSGWKCTTQNSIEKFYGIKTKGYYIGVQEPDAPLLPLDREGLIFCEVSPRSEYYDYLGMNIPFLQQLLAAPHGTALQYTHENGRITVLHEWDPMEKALYEKRIRKLQEYMLLKFRGMCAWDDLSLFGKQESWALAKQSMKSSLFAKGTRLGFIRECTENYVQNFRQENRGKVQYDYKKAKLDVDIIWHPAKYLRYFAKIQRTGLYDHRIVRMIYGPFARAYYGYTLLLYTIKGVFAGRGKEKC